MYKYVILNYNQVLIWDKFLVLANEFCPKIQIPCTANLHYVRDISACTRFYFARTANSKVQLNQTSVYRWQKARVSFDNTNQIVSKNTDSCRPFPFVMCLFQMNIVSGKAVCNSMGNRDVKWKSLYE